METTTIYGSTKEEIKNQQIAVLNLLRAVSQALDNAYPNQRNYSPFELEEYVQARKEHETRHSTILRMIKETEVAIKKIDLL